MSTYMEREENLQEAIHISMPRDEARATRKIILAANKALIDGRNSLTCSVLGRQNLAYQVEHCDPADSEALRKELDDRITEETAIAKHMAAAMKQINDLCEHFHLEPVFPSLTADSTTYEIAVISGEFCKDAAEYFDKHR